MSDEQLIAFWQGVAEGCKDELIKARQWSRLWKRVAKRKQSSREVLLMAIDDGDDLTLQTLRERDEARLSAAECREASAALRRERDEARREIERLRWERGKVEYLLRAIESFASGEHPAFDSFARETLGTLLTATSGYLTPTEASDGKE